MFCRLAVNAVALFRRKPRIGLHSPRRAKVLLRWAIERRVAVAYVLALVWVPLVTALLATGVIGSLGCITQRSLWLLWSRGRTQLTQPLAPSVRESNVMQTMESVAGIATDHLSGYQSVWLRPRCGLEVSARQVRKHLCWPFSDIKVSKTRNFVERGW